MRHVRDRRSDDDPIVGRDHELDQLGAMLQRVMGGDRQIALVLREAGIGTSRLVRELSVTAAAAGFEGVIGHRSDASASSARVRPPRDRAVDLVWGPGDVTSRRRFPRYPCP